MRQAKFGKTEINRALVRPGLELNRHGRRIWRDRVIRRASRSAPSRIPGQAATTSLRRQVTSPGSDGFDRGTWLLPMAATATESRLHARDTG